MAQLLPEAEPAAALARGAGRGAAQEGDHLDLNRFFILSTNLTYNHEYSQRYFFSFTSTEHKKLKAYNVSNFSDNRVNKTDIYVLHFHEQYPSFYGRQKLIKVKNRKINSLIKNLSIKIIINKK